MNDRKIITGRVLSFSENPFNHHFNLNSLTIDNKYIYVINDKIEFIDDTPNLNLEYENAERIDHGEHVIMAGFVDAHVHYPQTAIIASWGKRLIDWLNTYTFPEEMRFGDPDYAAEIAARYVEFAYAMARQAWPAIAQFTPKALRPFSPQLRIVTCALLREKPVWIVMRPTGCATVPNPPMMTASR